MNSVESSYIDLQPLMDEVEGNLAICKMLINSFIEDIEHYIVSVKKEMEANNHSALYQVNHKIIPSVRIFNIEKLEPVLIQLENDLKDSRDIKSISNNVNFCLEVFEKVKIELQNELKSIS